MSVRSHLVPLAGKKPLLGQKIENDAAALEKKR
jgi:hypothetical protein